MFMVTRHGDPGAWNFGAVRTSRAVTARSPEQIRHSLLLHRYALSNDGGEGVFYWHPNRQSLYRIDVFRPRLHRQTTSPRR